METFIGVVIGAVGGFAVHALSMQVNFKQRTIDDKIKAYEQLIAHWVQMRNFVVANQISNATRSPESRLKFDEMYGESQTYIGETYLICEDGALSTAVNDINERLFRTRWHEMKVDEVNTQLDQIKIEVIGLIARLREDIRKSTRLSFSDLRYMLTGRQSGK